MSHQTALQLVMTDSFNMHAHQRLHILRDWNWPWSIAANSYDGVPTVCHVYQLSRWPILSPRHIVCVHDSTMTFFWCSSSFRHLTDGFAFH